MKKEESALAFKELSAVTWKDFEMIMGPKGGCGGCWCMSWRVPRAGKYSETVQGEPNRLAMKDLVFQGKAFGILAYVGRKPVGWCSFGPREHYPRLGRTKAYRREDTIPAWSVPCFFVRKDWRGKGLSMLLLQQAVEAAKRKGSKVVEGCPVTKTKDGKKLPAAFSWTGPEIIFKRCGFKDIQRLAPTRPLYRKELE